MRFVATASVVAADDGRAGGGDPRHVGAAQRGRRERVTAARDVGRQGPGRCSRRWPRTHHAAGAAGRQQRLRREPEPARRRGTVVHRAVRRFPASSRWRTSSCTAGCSPTPSPSPTRPGAGRSTSRRCWPTARFSRRLPSFGIKAPKTLEIPLTENVSDSLRPGQLRQAATWGPWVSVGPAILAGVLALLTLAAARSRGKALGALGVSALLVGAAGWAGIEVARAPDRRRAQQHQR